MKYRARLAGILVPFLAALAFVPGSNAASLGVAVANHIGDPVADAVVYAVPLAGSIAPPQEPATVVIEQVNFLFKPFVTAVRTGTRVRFPNRDNDRHNVYSFSPAKVFELPLYKGEPPHPVVFDKPGIVSLGCNIHDWMLAHVYVLDTPHFAVTDGTGRVRIEGLEAADYEVKVWHPGLKGSLKSASHKITLAEAGQDIRFSIKLRGERFWRPKRPF